MEKLKQYEFKSGSGTYDWDTILDGNIYRLKPEEDFACTPKSFNLMARTQAKKRGGKARVAEEKNEGEVEALVVQFIEAEESK